MTPAQTYRMYAEMAVDMAADTTDQTNRVSLLEIAQAWQKLAEKQDRLPPSITATG
jgi:hypothetical protein